MKKQKYDKTQDGKRIDNIPYSGTLTGNWECDIYGYWWEYKLDKPDITDAWGQRDHAWIIGEAPNDI